MNRKGVDVEKYGQGFTEVPVFISGEEVVV